MTVSWNSHAVAPVEGAHDVVHERVVGPVLPVAGLGGLGHQLPAERRHLLAVGLPRRVEQQEADVVHLAARR